MRYDAYMNEGEMPASGKGNMNANELAAELGATPKATRRFLRAMLPTELHATKGGRYDLDLTPDALDELRIRFDAYSAKKARTLTIDDFAD